MYKYNELKISLMLLCFFISPLLLNHAEGAHPHAVLASCGCKPPEQGPSGFLGTFGSFYTSAADVDISPGEIIPIDSVNSNSNVNFDNSSYEVEILESGYYFIGYSISNDASNPSDVAIFINEVLQANTRHSIPGRTKKIISVAFAIALQAGDILVIRDVRDSGFTTLLGTGSNSRPPPVTAYLNAIRLGPL